MSRYIKREDATKRILQQCDNDCLYCMFNWQNDSGDYCAVEDCFADLPTIEVSEDCISREDLLKHAYKREGVLSVSVDSIRLAPSVVPSKAEC